MIVRSFQVVSSMLSKWLRESSRQLLLWTSLATSLTAVLTIATGVFLALDSFSLTDSAAPIKQLGSEVLDLEITRSFEDFYSVFNENGGWQNFSIVLIAVRQLQFSLCQDEDNVTSLIGGVHHFGHHSPWVRRSELWVTLHPPNILRTTPSHRCPAGTSKRIMVTSHHWIPCLSGYGCSDTDQPRCRDGASVKTSLCSNSFDQVPLLASPSIPRHVHRGQHDSPLCLHPPADNQASWERIQAPWPNLVSPCLIFIALVRLLYIWDIFCIVSPRPVYWLVYHSELPLEQCFVVEMCKSQLVLVMIGFWELSTTE